MKPIRILSPMLDLQGEIDNYLSLSFCRSYHFPGEFQLVTNRKVQNADKLNINGREMGEKRKLEQLYRLWWTVYF